jgi:hypothetical protein
VSNYGSQFMACPRCNKTIEAESVDVGVGLYVKDEWACNRCGWEMYGPEDFGFIDCDEIPFNPNPLTNQPPSESHSDS